MTLLRDHDLIDALRMAVGEMAGGQFEEDLPLTIRRVRYLFEVDSVWAAALVVGSQYASALAQAMADAGSPLDAVERHAQAEAVIAGLFAAFKQWWLAGASEPVPEVIDRALTALRFPDRGVS